MISEIEQSKAEQKNSRERRRKSPERERETGEWIGMDMDGVFRKKMERSERSEGLVRVLEWCLGKREREGDIFRNFIIFTKMPLPHINKIKK